MRRLMWISGICPCARPRLTVAFSKWPRRTSSWIFMKCSHCNLIPAYFIDD